MSRTLITHKGRTIGYETLDATGRHFHLGQPPQAALRANQPANRCPECQRYRPQGIAACTNCGALPTPVPAPPIAPGNIPMPVPSVPWWQPAAQPPGTTGTLPFTPVPWEPKTGPETNMGERLDMAIAARSRGRVGNFGPPPAPARVAIVPVRAKLTFPPRGSLFDRIIQRQQDLGRQPSSLPAPVRTMGAQAACERCHKQRCHCPPAAPRTLELVAAKHKARLAVMEATATAAGLPELRRVVGMS